MKKIWLPNLMCFRGGLSTLRTHVWRRQIHEQDRTLKAPVHPPWIYASGVFRSCLYEVFVDRLFFFVSPLKQNLRNDTMIRNDKAWLQFKTWTHISTVWLLMVSDCWSIANFSSRQLGFVDAHKNLLVCSSTCRVFPRPVSTCVRNVGNCVRKLSGRRPLPRPKGEPARGSGGIEKFEIWCCENGHF